MRSDKIYTLERKKHVSQEERKKGTLAGSRAVQREDTGQATGDKGDLSSLAAQND